MLRRAENIGVRLKGGLFTGNGWVHLTVGRTEYRTMKVHRDEYLRLTALQRQFPVRFGTIRERQYWMFTDRFYWDNDHLAPEQVHALLVTRSQRQAERIDRAQAMVAIGATPRPAVRHRIPDDVKQYVWLRDGGRCTHCGSTAELQFDHVIPVSMGGSSEPENLQILCGPCNRRKNAGLTLH